MIYLLTCVMYTKEDFPLEILPSEFWSHGWYGMFCQYASPLVSFWWSGWGG